MIKRGQNFKPIELNLNGSSVFGRYPKISIEKTWNMFSSDNFLVPYSGYQIAINASQFNNGKQGRGTYTSTKFDRIFVVIDSGVYMVNIFFDQTDDMPIDSQIILLGNLQTSSGTVYFAENNKPQILISDGTALYTYDPTLNPAFSAVTGLNFTPGYVTFHDTYFLCAATNDNFYSPAATNTWRLSGQNDGRTWLNNAASIGLLQTKPDSTQAVVRFPSKGNTILVMGSIVTESWFDTGAQLFPYQRNNQFNIDYGCISPATVAYSDEIVVWLAQNEKSGPIIMYTTGGMPEKITTDGIDYLFSQLKAPQNSQAFLYRQDGHLFYHINFYTDNLSLFYDFNTKKFYNASDQNLNYFIAGSISFFNNQYYFTSINTGHLYAFDTIYTTYQDTDASGTVNTYEIPRMRTCKNVRLPSQEYFIANDVGFTIETGETDYQTQILANNPIFLITQDNKFIITQGAAIFFVTQDGNFIVTQDNKNLISQQTNINDFSFLILQNFQQGEIVYSTPRVDLSISIDGGATFGSDMPYVLNPIGKRKNRLMWWQAGLANDFVCQFKFWGIGRFVCTDGVVNIRQ
jgi:hypothetical protein